MRKVVSAGGLIFDGRRMLVVKHAHGIYGLVKGHVETGETIEQAAIREVREEAGLDAQIIRYVGKVTRPSTEDTGELVEKDIELFLMRAIGPAGNTPEEQVEWLDFDKALQCKWHPEELAFLKQYVSALVDVAPDKDDITKGNTYRAGS